jgi:uncharacterized protein involved in exopolysaccharide biosynthesis
MTNNIKNTNQTDTVRSEHKDEIDLIQLAKTLWNGRRTVIKTTLVFMLLGLFIAIFSAKEYTASCVMVPQSAESGNKLDGSLGGLAAMAGINLGSIGASDIPTSLYPKIIRSIPFQKELMNTSLTIEKQENDVMLMDYYLKIKKPGLLHFIKKYTIGLPRLLIRLLKGNTVREHEPANTEKILTVTIDEKKIIDILSSKIKLEVNDKDGYISLSATMPEAKAAAQLARKAQELLQEAITKFKIQKAEEQLLFIEERYAEKQKEAENAQKRLAQFLDRNKNMTTAIAKTERERLNAEYSLVYGVYSELAKQLETQKIKVKEDTPVFTVIQPVSIPIERSKPRRAMILVIWTVLGGILGVGLVFGKKLWVSLKEKLT